MSASSTQRYIFSVLALVSIVLIAGHLLFDSLPSITPGKENLALLSRILNRRSCVTVPISNKPSETSSVPNRCPAVNPGCVSRRLRDYKPHDSGLVYFHPPVVQYAKLSASNSDVNLTFMDYIALMSAYKFLKPERIVILTYTDISGKYWDLTQKWKSTSVDMKKVERIQTIGGKNASHFIEHHADFIKLQSLLENGGIISDFDVIVINGTKLKNMQRVSECVLSKERSVLNVGFMSCVRNSAFIQKWLETYHKKYRPKDFLKNSAVYPKEVLERKDSCYNVYVVDGIASGPTYDGFQDWLTYDSVNWEEKVAAHYFNKILKSANESMLGQNHPFGEMLRYVVNS